jgi:single-strand DNA-binding protein
MARSKSTITAEVPESSTVATVSAPENADENRTILTGRLCADPVLRHTASGTPVANLRIAVNSPEGEATFHDVVVWKRTAEVVRQYLKKGRLVEVIGRSRERTWTDQDGNERTSVEVSAFRVQFLNGQRAAQAAENALS